MGNSASRDALDLDLVRSEYEILSCQHNYVTAVRSYGRMVDDISAIFQGPFSSVVKTIILMAKKYPAMPLNIQYSLNHYATVDFLIFICTIFLNLKHPIMGFILH